MRLRRGGAARTLKTGGTAPVRRRPAWLRLPPRPSSVVVVAAAAAVVCQTVLLVGSGVVTMGFMAFRTTPDSCSAGVEDLAADLAEILSNQSSTVLSTTECVPSWDEPGRFVRATATSAFSCPVALDSFASVYGAVPRNPTPEMEEETNYPGPFVERDGTRYYLQCLPAMPDPDTTTVYLSQELADY